MRCTVAGARPVRATSSVMLSGRPSSKNACSIATARSTDWTVTPFVAACAIMLPPAKRPLAGNCSGHAPYVKRVDAHHEVVFLWNHDQPDRTQADHREITAPGQG